MRREVRAEIQIWLLTSISWKFKEEEEQEEQPALSDTAEKFNRTRIFKSPLDLTVGRSAMTSR